MRLMTCMRALLAGAGLLTSSVAMSQALSTAPDKLDVALDYSILGANVVNGSRFWMQGGSARVAFNTALPFALTADVAGEHTARVAPSSVGLDLILLTFGPQFALSGRHVSFFGSGRVGIAFGRNSPFPTSTTSPTSDVGTAISLGGGVDLPVTRRFAVRVFETEWNRTQLNNLNANGQNSTRISAGLLLRLP